MDENQLIINELALRIAQLEVDKASQSAKIKQLTADLEEATTPK